MVWLKIRILWFKVTENLDSNSLNNILPDIISNPETKCF